MQVRKRKSLAQREKLVAGRQLSRLVTEAIDFHPRFVDDILAGRKTATTRFLGQNGEPQLAALSLGQVCVATSGSVDGVGGDPFALLRIKKLRECRFDDLDDDLAATEALVSGDQLRTVLREFYPAIKSVDTVLVVSFEVCHPDHPDHPERILR